MCILIDIHKSGVAATDTCNSLPGSDYEQSDIRNHDALALHALTSFLLLVAPLHFTPSKRYAL